MHHDITHFSLSDGRMNVPRPLSEATLIFDTDDEDDSESPPSSLVFDSDTQPTCSSRYEVKTPSTAGLGGFDFHFEPNPVERTYGLRLCRAASTSSPGKVLSLSPIPVQKPQIRRAASLNAPVPQLDDPQVCNWSPRQVAHWLVDAGFTSAVVAKFLSHDICGSILLDLQLEDLKGIDISSFSECRQVMSSIQDLRTSSGTLSPGTFVPQSSSSATQPQSLSRVPHPGEARVVACGRTISRRGRQGRQPNDILPTDSVSFAAIEQALPELHTYLKEENCPKSQKQRRKTHTIKQDSVEETSRSVVESTVAISNIGSSDVLGPDSAALTLTAERLDSVESRNPQESVRQFLDFQNTHPAKKLSLPPTTSNDLLQGPPKFSIPMPVMQLKNRGRIPISTLRPPTQVQVQLEADLLDVSRHHGGLAFPKDVYCVSTQMSATDAPVIAMPINPYQRATSQSVSPKIIRYDNISTSPVGTIRQRHCTQTTPRRRHPSFVPFVTPIDEGEETLATAVPPIVTDEAEISNHAGWMRKRKQLRMLRHEWRGHYFKLHGTLLYMYDTDGESSVLDSIDVENFNVLDYTPSGSLKYDTVFKKTFGSTSKEPSFAFELVPEDQQDKKVKVSWFAHNHYFAVNSDRDRVEWVRKIKLAKALKRNEAQVFQAGSLLDHSPPCLECHNSLTSLDNNALLIVKNITCRTAIPRT